LEYLRQAGSCSTLCGNDFGKPDRNTGHRCQCRTYENSCKTMHQEQGCTNCTH